MLSIALVPRPCVSRQEEDHLAGGLQGAALEPSHRELSQARQEKRRANPGHRGFPCLLVPQLPSPLAGVNTGRASIQEGRKTPLLHSVWWWGWDPCFTQAFLKQALNMYLRPEARHPPASHFRHDQCTSPHSAKVQLSPREGLPGHTCYSI